MRTKRHTGMAMLFVLLALPGQAAAQDIPAEYQAVLTTLGKTGDFKDGVLKVNIPRTDLKVTIGERPAPTPFGFGGWVALTKGDGGHRRDDGRPRAHRGRSQSGDVGAARQRPRRHRAAQPLLLGTAAHLLHARARHGQPRRTWRDALKPAVDSDRPGGDSARRRRPAPRRRHRRRRSTARRSRRSSATRASRPDRSTRSRSAGRTSTCASTARDQRAHGAQHLGRVRRAPTPTRWSPATSRCSSTK